MEEFLKISEFAALSGISRELLIFYDKNGIFHPKWVDPANGYRYYSYRQIDTASVIVSFRKAGMSLESIRSYLLRRSPEQLLDILSEQERTLNRQIQKLRQVKGVVRARLEQTRRGLAAAAGEVSLRDCPPENLFLGPMLPEEYELADGWSYLPAFYDACAAQGIPIGFTVSTLVSRDHLQNQLWNKPARYYCRLPEDQYPVFYTRPAGRYVTGTRFADYGCTDGLYREIFRYIGFHGLQVCGNAYEEFLIDEIGEQDADSYLLQIAVQVG